MSDKSVTGSKNSSVYNYTAAVAEPAEAFFLDDDKGEKNMLPTKQQQQQQQQRMNDCLTDYLDFGIFNNETQSDCQEVYMNPTDDYAKSYFNPNNNGSSTTINSILPAEKNYWWLFLVPLVLVAIFGNALVCFAVAFDRKLRGTGTNKFIASLALSDLLVGALVMPFGLYIKIEGNQWRLPDRVCRFHLCTTAFSTTASIVHLVAISIDRYFAIIFPTEYQRHSTRTSTGPYIIMIWLISGTISLTALMEKIDLKNQMCWLQDPQYLILSSLMSFILPASIVCYLYIKIFRKLSHHLTMKWTRKKGTNQAQPKSLPQVVVEEVRSRRNSWLSNRERSGSSGSKEGGGSRSSRSASQPDIAPDVMELTNIPHRFRSPTICEDRLGSGLGSGDSSPQPPDDPPLAPLEPSSPSSQQLHQHQPNNTPEITCQPPSPFPSPRNSQNDMGERGAEATEKDLKQSLLTIDGMQETNINLITTTTATLQQQPPSTISNPSSPTSMSITGNPVTTISNSTTGFHTLSIPQRTWSCGKQKKRGGGRTGGSGGFGSVKSVQNNNDKKTPSFRDGDDGMLTIKKLYAGSGGRAGSGSGGSTANVIEAIWGRKKSKYPRNNSLSVPIRNGNKGMLGGSASTTELLSVPSIHNNAAANSHNATKQRTNFLSVPDNGFLPRHSFSGGPDADAHSFGSGTSGGSTITSGSSRSSDDIRHSVISFGSSLTDDTSGFSSRRASALSDNASVMGDGGDRGGGGGSLTRGSRRISSMTPGKLRQIASQVTRAIRRKRRESLAIRRESKATRVVAAILVVFIVCWLPFFCAAIYRGIKRALAKEMNTNFQIHVYLVTSWLGYAHSCFNPVIYTCLNRNFRSTFKRFMRCARQRRRSSALLSGIESVLQGHS